MLYLIFIQFCIILLGKNAKINVLLLNIDSWGHFSKVFKLASFTYYG